MKLSQNKKIVLSSVSIFFVSLIAFLFFMQSQGIDVDFSQTNTLKTSHQSENPALSNNEAAPSADIEKTWFRTDFSGNFVDTSSNFNVLINAQSSKELIGTLLFDYINAEDLPAIVSQNSKLLREGTEIEGLGPYRLQSKDGEEFLVIFNATPILDKDKKVKEIYFSVKDITAFVEKMKQSHINTIYAGESAEETKILDELSEKIESVIDELSENSEKDTHQLKKNIEKLKKDIEKYKLEGKTQTRDFAGKIEKLKLTSPEFIRFTAASG